MSKVFAVMESVGNFSHTVEEFDEHDQAIQFMMNRARNDAQDQFEDIHNIPELEYDIEFGNALSYYNVDEWEV